MGALESAWDDARSPAKTIVVEPMRKPSRADMLLTAEIHGYEAHVIGRKEIEIKRILQTSA